MKDIIATETDWVKNPTFNVLLKFFADTLKIAKALSTPGRTLEISLV